MTFVSATPRRAAACASASTVTCALGTIASGADVTRRDQGRHRRAGHDHERGDACCPRPPTRTRPTTPRAPTTTVKPVADLGADQVGLPGPGAGRPAADLHPRRLERRPARRHRRDGHRHAAGRRRPSTRPRPRRAAARRRAARSPARSARSPTAARASVDDQGPAAERGQRHEPGERQPPTPAT